MQDGLDAQEKQAAEAQDSSARANQALVEQLQAAEASAKSGERERDALQAELQAEREKNRSLGIGIAGGQGGQPSGVDGNLSVTEVYGRYLHVCDELTTSQGMCREMEKYISQIQEEIARKAPVIQQQRFQYNRMVESYNQLTAKLSEASTAYSAMSTEYKLATDKASQLTRQNELLQQETDDLARQVRALLKAQHQQVASAPTSFSSASEVPVVVISVDDMQSKNQQLLSAVRSLAKDHEEKCAEVRALQESLGAVEKVQNELKQAYESISQLRSDRQALEARFNAVSEHLKLLQPQEAQAPREGGQQGSADGLGAEERAALEQKLAASAAKAAEEAARLHEFQRQSLADEREHKARLDAAQRETTDVLIRLARREAELKHEQEWSAKHQAAADLAAKEIDQLRSKNALLSASISRHESELETARAELSKVRDDLRSISSEAHSLRSEKELLVGTERRLRADNEQMLAQRNRQEKMLANLESMHMNLEKKDADSRAKLISEHHSAKNELLALRKELDDERRRSRESADGLRVRADDLRARLEATEEKLAGVREEGVRLATHLEHRSARAAELEGSLAAAQKQLDALLARRLHPEHDLSGSEFSGLGKLRQTEIDLKSAVDKVAALEQDLAGARQHNHDLQRLASQNETALKEVTAASSALKARTDKEGAALRVEKDALQKRAEEMRQLSLQTELETTQLREHMEGQLAEAGAALAASKSDLARAESALAAAQASIASLESELARQTKQCGDAQESYQRELMMHAATVGTVSGLKSALAAAQDQLRGLTERCKDSEAQRASEAAEAQRRLAHADEAVRAADARVADRDRQVELLYSQMEASVAQARHLQEENAALLSPAAAFAAETLIPSSSARGSPAKASGAGATDMGTSCDQAAKSVRDLNEIVTYLRREKKTAELELEKLQLESAKLQQGLRHAQGTIGDLKELLHKEQEAHAASKASASSSQGAGAKPGADQQSKLLVESNQHLRAENARVAAQLADVKRELAALQTRLSPLEAELRAVGAEKSALEAEKKSLDEQNALWKQRNQKLLNKYQQVDPVLHEQLQAERNALFDERGKLAQEVQAAREGLTEAQRVFAAEKARADKAMKDLEESKRSISQLNMHQRTQLQAQSAGVGKVAAEAVAAADSSIAGASRLVHDMAAALREKKSTAAKQAEEIEKMKKELNTVKMRAGLFDKAAKEKASKLVAQEAELKTAKEQVAALSEQLVQSQRSCEELKSSSSANSVRLSQQETEMNAMKQQITRQQQAAQANAHTASAAASTAPAAVTAAGPAPSAASAAPAAGAGAGWGVRPQQAIRPLAAGAAGAAGGAPAGPARPAIGGGPVRPLISGFAAAPRLPMNPAGVAPAPPYAAATTVAATNATVANAPAAPAAAQLANPVRPAPIRPANVGAPAKPSVTASPFAPSAVVPSSGAANAAPAVAATPGVGVAGAAPAQNAMQAVPSQASKQFASTKPSGFPLRPLLPTPVSAATVPMPSAVPPATNVPVASTTTMTTPAETSGLKRKAVDTDIEDTAAKKQKVRDFILKSLLGAKLLFID